MSLSENIDRYLECNGIMKKFVAEKTGMTQSAVTQSLSGKRKLTADEYISICRALDVPLETFLTENTAYTKHKQRHRKEMISD